MTDRLVYTLESVAQIHLHSVLTRNKTEYEHLRIWWLKVKGNQEALQLEHDG